MHSEHKSPFPGMHRGHIWLDASSYSIGDSGGNFSNKYTTGIGLEVERIPSNTFNQIKLL